MRVLKRLLNGINHILPHCDKMRVLQVYHHFRPCTGGIERHIEDLCINLINKGHKSDVVCLDYCHDKKEKLPHYEEYKNIEINRLPFVDLKIYNIAPGVLKIIKHYDLIHVHGIGFFSDFLALTSFIHRIPLILTTHGGIFHTKNHYFLKKIYFNLWCKFIFKRFKRIIAVSKNDEKSFSKVSSRVTFIPNGIELKDFSNISKSEEKNSFIFVGRLSKNKRVDNLIRMIFFLKKKVKNVKLYVIGEDWEETLKDLKKLTEDLELKENVIFLGKVRDRIKLINYYSRAQFFLSASQYEGFGITVLEAMASGKIVAVNDISPFKEFVKNNENGFIVDYSRPKVAANKIFSLLNKDLSNVKKRASATVEDYSWGKIIKKIESIYETGER